MVLSTMMIVLFVIVVSVVMAAVPGKARAAQNDQQAYRAAVDRAVEWLAERESGRGWYPLRPLGRISSDGREL